MYVKLNTVIWICSTSQKAFFSNQWISFQVKLFSGLLISINKEGKSLQDNLGFICHIVDLFKLDSVQL